MSAKPIKIGNYLYVKEEFYNKDEYYDYVEDDKGNLYICHYGHDGDQNWHITCFEDVDGNGLRRSINEKYYYRRIGQILYKIDYVDDLNNFVGMSLSKEEISGRIKYGFINLDEWKFYILEEF